jgi:hypothetical protein
MAATSAFTQVTSGSVFGSVRDVSGAVIPGATVVLISSSRGTSVETTTNENGDFTFPNALGDTYTVRVTMDGFKTLERPNVPVSPGERVVVPALVIELGTLNETITVTGDAPMIQAQSGERSFTVTTEAVQNLPIANRSFAALTGLTPGVVGTNRLGGGGQNNVMQDGVSTMDTGSNGGNGMLQLNPDAIAEVRVLSQAYQAEYGRSSGLQISAVSKSGTNQFRGSIYDIERNSDWNSISWAAMKNGDPKPVSRERDFGYTIGGPIGKPGGQNKLFFFYAHEYRPRKTSGAINRFRVPTALERKGDFSESRDNNGNLFNLIRDASTGMPCTAANTSGCFRDGGVLGRIPQDRLYDLGLNVLNVWPLPNTTGLNYNLELARPVIDNLIQQPLVRIDYQVSSRMRLLGKYASQRQRVFITPGTIPGFNDITTKHPFIHHFAITADYALTPTMFVEATYGMIQNRLTGGGSGGVLMTDASNRNNIGLGNFPLLYPDANIVDPRYYAYETLAQYDTPMYADGRIMLPPVFDWGSRIANAPPNLLYPGWVNINRTQDFSISATKLAGRHTLKAGFYLNHSYKAQNRETFPVTGRVNFGQDSNNPLDAGFGFANAALGTFNSYSQQSSYVEGNYLYNNIEGYIQDNWKVNDRLTLDYGMRFTHQQPQYDAFLQASNFLPDRWSQSEAPVLYVPGCAGRAPCATSARQAIDPLTGNSLGPNSAIAIGTIVPNSGNRLNGIFQAGQGIAKENYVWPKLALAPRFGMAYDVTGMQKLIVRGGLGLFFDRPEGNSIYNQIANPPHSQATTVRYAQLQTLGSAGLSTAAPPQMSIFWYDSELPSSFQWNSGVQMTLPWSSAIDVSYVGQRGFNLIRSQEATPTGGNAHDLNAVDFGAAYLPQNQDPTLNPSSVPGATAVTTDLLRPYRGLGALNVMWGRTWNEYHSLQASFNRRYRDGLQFGLNYTLGLSYKGNTITPLRLQHAADGSFSIRADQAEADKLLEDTGLRRHTLKGSFVWDLPDLERDGGVARAVGLVANDWQLSGVLTAGSGATYDVSYSYQTAGSNVNLTGSPSYGARVRIVGDPGSGCSSNQYGQFNTAAFAGPTYGSLGLESGRNYLNGCVDKTLDFAIARNFRIGGSRTAQFRVDLFNAFNAVVISNRVTQLQLTNPTAQAVRNNQYNADGSLNQQRLTPRTAGFGAATAAQGMRSVQIQLRFQF